MSSPGSLSYSRMWATARPNTRRFRLYRSLTTPRGTRRLRSAAYLLGALTALGFIYLMSSMSRDSAPLIIAGLSVGPMALLVAGELIEAQIEIRSVKLLKAQKLEALNERIRHLGEEPNLRGELERIYLTDGDLARAKREARGFAAWSKSPVEVDAATQRLDEIAEAYEVLDTHIEALDRLVTSRERLVAAGRGAIGPRSFVPDLADLRREAETLRHIAEAHEEAVDAMLSPSAVREPDALETSGTP